MFQGQGHYQPVSSIHLPGYKVFTEGHTGQIKRAAAVGEGSAAGPLVYGGGGLVALRPPPGKLREFVEMTGHARGSHPHGDLGALPSKHPNFISMPGMQWQLRPPTWR